LETTARLFQENPDRIAGRDVFGFGSLWLSQRAFECIQADLDPDYLRVDKLVIAT
jgi:hypothetical protein